MDLRTFDGKAANVNAVEAEHRHRRRKTADGLAASIAEDLGQVEAAGELVASMVAPIVEVASDDQRGIVTGFPLKVIGKGMHLAPP